MELVELVSPHVAMPVIGVVVCAIMVFAFGFRSPVQPPSFDFEEDEKRIKRRPKPNKVKASTNGNVVQHDASPVEATSKPTSQVNKEKKVNTQSPKVSKAASRKENKQDSKSDKKVKKPGKESVKSGPVVPEKKDIEDDGEWTTIQVSKKGKKQKTVSKKDESQAEAAVTPANETDTSPAPHAAAAAAAAPVIEAEEPKTPQPEKGKKKKKNKSEERESQSAVETAVTESNNAALQVEEQVTEVKKKKNKRDKKSNAPATDADGAAASASENLPQDATPASGKVSKKETNAGTLDVGETIADVPKQSPKKKKGKGKDVTENVTEKVATVKSLPDDKQESSEQTKPEKSESTNKAENENVPAAKSEIAVESSNSQASPANAATSSGISFDEIGDSWIEAAPKSKKKKSRREN